MAAGSASDPGALCSSGRADKHLFALRLPGQQGWGPFREALTSKHLGVWVTGMGNGLTKGSGHFCLTWEEAATVVSDVKVKADEAVPSSSPLVLQGIGSQLFITKGQLHWKFLQNCSRRLALLLCDLVQRMPCCPSALTSPGPPPLSSS